MYGNLALVLSFVLTKMSYKFKWIFFNWWEYEFNRLLNVKKSIRYDNRSNWLQIRLGSNTLLSLNFFNGLINTVKRIFYGSLFYGWKIKIKKKKIKLIIKYLASIFWNYEIDG